MLGSKEPEDEVVAVGAASGIGGRSTVPFPTLTIMALALARTILSSQAFTASMSPSRPLLTSSAISFSLLSVMPIFL